MKPRQIHDSIFWVGVNDTQTSLFENQLSLPHGIAYNSYLILDDQVVLIDTVKGSFFSSFLSSLKGVLQGRPIDYLVINHMEPDHSGAVDALIELYPKMKLIGNSKTRDMVRAYFHHEIDFVEVQDGQRFSIGKKELQFFFIPMVHWPETMVTYDSSSGTLFSCDAFGGFGTLDGGIFDDELDFSVLEGEMLRYYANIVGRYSSMVQKALNKLGGIQIQTIAPSHGMVWRKDPRKVIGLYDRWSRQDTERGAVVVYGTMYGNTETMAYSIAKGMRDSGLHNIILHNLSKSDHSEAIRDIWRMRGLALGCCTYNMSMFPKMDALVRSIDNKMILNRIAGLFGTYTWSGGGMKGVQAFVEKWKWPLIGPQVEVKGVPTSEDLSQTHLLGKHMALEILKS